MNWRRYSAAGVVILTVWLAARSLDRNEAKAPPTQIAKSSIQRQEEDPDVPATRSAVPNDATATRPAGGKGLPRAIHRTVIAPNPDITKPVEQIRFWRRAAMTGEPYASCRFASVSAGCALRRAVYSPWARNGIQNLRTTDGELIGEDCDGVTDADVQGRFDALLGAAQRGHTPSALLFASGIGSSSFIPVPDDIRRFRAHAPRLAWQAFDAGDSDAAVLLWRAYNRVGVEAMPLAGAIDSDPIKAHALDLLMNDLVPDFVVGTAAEAGLSKEQAAQAEALHAEWRATSFAHARPPRFGMEIERMFDPEKRAVDLCAPDPR